MGLREMSFTVSRWGTGAGEHTPGWRCLRLEGGTGVVLRGGSGPGTESRVTVRWTHQSPRAFSVQSAGGRVDEADRQTDRRYIQGRGIPVSESSWHRSHINVGVRVVAMAQTPLCPGCPGRRGPLADPFLWGCPSLAVALKFEHGTELMTLKC